VCVFDLLIHFVDSFLTDGRWSKDSLWTTCGLASDFYWKINVEKVMSLYTEATDGSFIEEKESAMVWQHQEADPDFGLWQAKELLVHLESMLANDPVVVKRGQHIVEVKPQVSYTNHTLLCILSF
jgi:trehalose 6-phosphate synthase/phosphatase